MNVDPPSGNRRRVWKATILVIGIALLVVGGTVTGLSIARSDNPQPTLEPLKQAAIDSDEQARANALANPPSPGATKQETIVNQTNAPWPTGIIKYYSPPYPPSAVSVEGAWQQLLDGNHIEVYVGALGSGTPEHGRGLVDVWAFSEGGRLIRDLGATYLVPAGVGAVHIVSYEGTLLTLEASTGETFYFDAETRAFTDANGNPVVTDTPTPTPEPSPEPTATPPVTAQPTVAQTAATGLGG